MIVDLKKDINLKLFIEFNIYIIYFHVLIRHKIRRSIKKAYFELKPAEKDDPKAKQKAEEGINKVFESVMSCIARKNMVRH